MKCVRQNMPNELMAKFLNVKSIQEINLQQWFDCHSNFDILNPFLVSVHIYIFLILVNICNFLYTIFEIENELLFDSFFFNCL